MQDSSTSKKLGSGDSGSATQQTIVTYLLDAAEKELKEAKHKMRVADVLRKTAVSLMDGEVEDNELLP